MTALLLAGVGSWSQASEEDRVARMVNEYRMDHGLPPVPFSRALTQVAVAHARDLEDHEPDAGTDGAGRRCTMHSWSRASGAKPVCYTADHARAVDMWNKPWEITRGRYKERGFEIAARYSEGIDADMAFDLWLGSPGHRAVILEQGGFRGSNWQAMGVAIDGRYAVVWFGKAPDPGR
nr:CAP domain-containing protein [Sphingomonas laterariae]